MKGLLSSTRTGLPAIALAQRRQSAPLKVFAQARRAGGIFRANRRQKNPAKGQS